MQLNDLAAIAINCTQCDIFNNRAVSIDQSLADQHLRFLRPTLLGPIIVYTKFHTIKRRNLNMGYQFLYGALLFCLASSASALEKGEFTLDISGFSKHSKSTYIENGTAHRYNETNPGLGISYGLSDNLDLRVGGFRNSYDKDSLYLGLNWHKDFYFGDWTVAPGLNFLLISGYESRTDIPFAILPALTFGHRAVKLSIGILPFGDESKVTTLQLQFNFKYF